jgi:hypothetical protein
MGERDEEIFLLSGPLREGPVCEPLGVNCDSDSKESRRNGTGELFVSPP